MSWLCRRHIKKNSKMNSSIKFYNQNEVWIQNGVSCLVDSSFVSFWSHLLKNVGIKCVTFFRPSKTLTKLFHAVPWCLDNFDVCALLETCAFITSLPSKIVKIAGMSRLWEHGLTLPKTLINNMLNILSHLILNNLYAARPLTFTILGLYVKNLCFSLDVIIIKSMDLLRFISWGKN